MKHHTPHGRKASAMLVAALSAIALAACSSGENDAANDAPPQDEATVEATAPESPSLGETLESLVGSHWRLVEIAGAATPDGSTADLEFPESGRLTGNGSVNRFNGGISVEDGTLQVTPLASTMMAGLPEDMEREQAYFAALQQADSLEIHDDGRLVITCRGQDEPLRFARIVTIP